MRKVLLGLALLLVAAVGYFAGAPYLSVLAIQKGIAENDSATLVRYIDFPVLRQNIKDQLNSTSEKEKQRSSQNNFMSALMDGFKARLVDSMVESVVTPEGLANLMAGRKSLTQASETPSAPQDKERIFNDARFTYDSLEQFSVWLPDDRGEETRLILRRQGLRWKLVNFVLPPSHKL